MEYLRSSRCSARPDLITTKTIRGRTPRLPQESDLIVRCARSDQAIGWCNVTQIFSWERGHLRCQGDASIAPLVAPILGGIAPILSFLTTATPLVLMPTARRFLPATLVIQMIPPGFFTRFLVILDVFSEIKQQAVTLFLVERVAHLLDDILDAIIGPAQTRIRAGGS